MAALRTMHLLDRGEGVAQGWGFEIYCRRLDDTERLRVLDRFDASSGF